MPDNKNPNSLRPIGLFILISFGYSWPIFFIVDGWLLPKYIAEHNSPAIWLTALFGHMLAMLGPAVGAVIMWRFYHKESWPSWKWSRLKYYGWAVLAMVSLWCLPALIGLKFGSSWSVRSPIETYMWVVIGSSLTLGWLAGLGEEVGWCAYLLPRLAPASAVAGPWLYPALFVDYGTGRS